jgi:hypothetical protein
MKMRGAPNGGERREPPSTGAFSDEVDAGSSQENATNKEFRKDIQ